MRIIEPHQLHAKRRKSTTVKRIVMIGLAVVIVVGGGLAGVTLLGKKTQHAAVKTSPGSQVMADTITTPSAPKTTPIEFTGNQFRDLYRQVMLSYPNTEDFPAPPSITGNSEADGHIRMLAEARGFRLTRIPVMALVKLNEPLISGERDDLLQPLAYQAWQQIKTSAQKDNVPLALMSAYRSPEFQRDLFTQRLLAKGVSSRQVISSQADSAIQATLGVTAVPGYSRHHTGYTVDFWCDDGSGNFANSVCYKWLKENNYLRAKQAGWIPSYPDGAEDQGPEPEPWEYVWVGRDVLFK